MTAPGSPRGSASVRALLAGAIDYAGLFPPAGLDMVSAATNYAQYRTGTEAWALGSFVLPATRLDELAVIAAPMWASDGGAPWRLSALAGSDPEADKARIARFEEAYGAYARVASVETRAGSLEAIGTLAGLFAGTETFVEIPLDGDLASLIGTLKASGARAKVRTGGVTPDAVPSTERMARFLHACAGAGVPFKATAGLHHPVRDEYRMTYASDSVRGTMFGYLNVFLAAVLAREGVSVTRLQEVLGFHDRATLAFTDREIAWHGVHVTGEQLAETRETFARAFGSCSFREPLDDLDTLFT